MDSTHTNETSMRNEEVKKFKDLLEIIEKLIKFLISVIALKPTKILDKFFTEHPIVATVTVLMTALYFMVWILGTMLQHRGELITMNFVWIILMIGSMCSVSVLSTVYPLIAWFTGILWISIFGVTGFYYYQNLHELFVSSVSDAIKKLMESYKPHTTPEPV